MSLVERLWWERRPGMLARLLGVLLAVPALLFRAIAALRGVLYTRGVFPVARAAVPVVSVGNLAVGGAGKTPATAALAARLAARGRRVAVLSRGYGATRRDPRVVSDGAAVLLGADEGGDEPVLLARRLRGVAVLCAPRRADLLPAAARLGADVLVLDDGFQHRALARDLDVVVLDASNPTGNGRLLPAGPNREPAEALRRAGLVWLSRVDRAEPAALDALRALAVGATRRPPVESRHAAVDVLDGTLAHSHGLGALRGRRVLALSALARPTGFRDTLAALGADIVAERVFPDHHRFTAAEFDDAFADADGKGALVATTEKDAVRLPKARAADARLRVVRIEAEIVAGADSLDAALDDLLACHPAAASAAGNAPSTAARTGTP